MLSMFSLTSRALLLYSMKEMFCLVRVHVFSWPPNPLPFDYLGVVFHVNASGQQAPDLGRLSLPCKVQGHWRLVQHQRVFGRVHLSHRVTHEPEREVWSLVKCQQQPSSPSPSSSSSLARSWRRIDFDFAKKWKGSKFFNFFLLRHEDEEFWLSDLNLWIMIVIRSNSYLLLPSVKSKRC